MDYFDRAQVQACLPENVKIDDSTTRPTSAQVDTWIVDVNAQADFAIAQGGSGTPATGDLASALALTGAREVAYQVMAVRSISYVPGSPNDGAVGPSIYDRWHKEWIEFLKYLRENTSTDSVDPGGLPWCHTIDANEEDPSDSKNPSFTKDYVP